MDPQANIPVTAFVPCRDMDEAKTISRTIVEEGLAACCNIIPTITSIYKWKGEVHEDSEALLLIKTRKAMIDELIDKVEALHSYEEPVIEVFESSAWPEHIEKWLEDSTK